MTKKFKNIIVFTLVLSIVLSLIPWTSISVNAIDIGNGTLIDKVTIGKAFDEEFNQENMYIEIQAPFGEDITNINIKIQTSDEGYIDLTNPVTQSMQYVKYIFPSDKANNFTGNIMIDESMVLNVNFNNLPILTSVPKKIINEDTVGDYYLTLKGNNMENINTNNPVEDDFYIKGYISKGGFTELMSNITTQTANEIQLKNPKSPGYYGLHNIIFSKTKDATQTTPIIEIQHVYKDQVQFVKDLEVSDLKMYPNVGAKGDRVYFEGKGLQKYDVYFLNIDGTDTFKDSNKGENPILEENIDGLETNRLIITIPSTLPIGKYFVVLTNKSNDEIISQKIIEDEFGNEVIFTVIDKSNRATINTINPTKGADLGGETVEILGNNLITLNIEGLNVDYSSSDINALNSTDKELIIEYPDGTYNGNNVTDIKRNISVIIGKEALIKKDGNNPKFILGSPDYLYVETQAITGIEDDPYADVKIVITTTFKENGTEYKFVEIAERIDAYKFIPSSAKPIIDNVIPEKVQVLESNNEYVFKENTLFVINGSDFLVTIKTDENGKTTKYPIILIKDENNLDKNNYEIKIDKTSDKIYYYENGQEKVISGIEYFILDNNGNYITGSEGNEKGTKILFKIPKEVKISDIGKKNIQILNPRKGSDLDGDTSIATDILEFLTVLESPVIESVNPNIVTVDGEEEIIVSGSNFHEGVKVYIDGEEVKNVVRDLDINGKKILLKFKAPKGREGTTQILVTNPDGGMDVEDFTYVKTINKDPFIFNISPNKGSQDTLVLINGDNFLKPDPSINSLIGMGIYRLLGTRVLLDGKDINIYNGTNTPELINYISPSIEKLFTIVDNELILSEFYKNTVIKDSDEKIYSITKSDDEITLRSVNKSYKIKLNDSKDKIIALNESNDSFDVSVELDKITINEETPLELNVTMDNKLISIIDNKDNTKVLKVSDYYNSVILQDENGDYYTLDINFKNEVILTDGNEKTYLVKLEKTNDNYKIVGVDDNNNSYEITVNDSGIIINGNSLTMKTPYTVNSKNVIVGHRVKVLNKNQLVFTVPKLNLEGKGEGWYNVTVKNPDTKEFTKYGEEGFYYFVNPSSNPEIFEITPNIGSVDGGYRIVIKGKEFEDTTKVYIDGIKIDEADVIVSADGTLITAIVPPYQGDITEEFETDRKTVPVVILNKDGGSDSLENGFTYVVPNSHPEIYNLTPNYGKASGGDIIEITGYDFRYFEPYKNKVGGPEYNVGDEFIDLNNNGKWDSLDNIEEWNTKESINHKFYDEYYTSPILPKVYFGNLEAKIVDFSNGYLKVIAPEYNNSGDIFVVLVNNDSGISNSIRFTYNTSKPKIDAVVPNIGKKQGNDTIEIIGEEFLTSNIEILNEDGSFNVKKMPIVRFGDISNRNLKIEEDYSGRIDNGRSLVKLEGNLTVEYVIDNGIKTVKFLVDDGKEIYQKTFNYDDTVKFISLDTLTNNDGENYYGYELIKIEVKDKRFFVDRGFSPETTLTTSNQIKVNTPSYHKVGKVNLYVINPDSGYAIDSFEYKNPSSNPKIYDITPKSEVFVNGTLEYYIVDSTIDGGITFKITGEDFRENVTVLIGSKKATVIERSEDDNEILVKAPSGNLEDLNRPLLITVYNEDGAIATSKDDTLIDKKPIYYVYKEIETNPIIEEITPNSGSSKGGERVVIKGYDFRTDSIEHITVRFGTNTAEVLINESTYKKLVVLTPSSDELGPVDVFVRNNFAFGETIYENGFTYYSNPTITSIYPYEVYITGGQEVTITGNQFSQGIEVYIGDKKAEKVTFIDENTLKVIVPVGDEGYKDVKLIAKDGGKTLIKNGIKYILPIPSTPTGLTSKAGHERSIILKWYESTGADRYKIYAKKYSDSEYVFVAETKNTEYILKDLVPDTLYYFKVYSLNEYGESKGYAFTTCKTLKESLDKFNDKYENKVKYSIIKKSTKNTIVSIPKFYSSNYTVDLTKLENRYTKNVQVNIPIETIKASYGNINILINDIKIYLPVEVLKKYISTIKNIYDSNIIIKTSYVIGREKSRLENKLNRNETFASELYLIEFNLQDGRKVESIKLNENITVSLLNEINNENIFVSKFDEELNKFIVNTLNSEEIIDVFKNDTLNYLNFETNSGGIFTLIKH